MLLHFGAIDWQADVYVNGLWVGSHEGAFDAFSMNIGDALQLDGVAGAMDELMVVVHDPSNYGGQPFGKQRTSAMWRPAGDTYSPNSGIWQPVWVEVVPGMHITALKLAPNMTHLNLNVATTHTSGAITKVTATVWKGSEAVASASFYPKTPFALAIPSPQLWSPEQPFLYNLTVAFGGDHVESYFGMREVTVCKDPSGVVRPCINGKYRFLTGVLDQSYWSDGIYLAPGDAVRPCHLHHATPLPSPPPPVGSALAHTCCLLQQRVAMACPGKALPS